MLDNSFLGLTSKNKSSNSVKATFLQIQFIHKVLDLLITQLEQVHQQTHKYTVLNEVPIPSGSSLEVFPGQKMVLNTNDILTLKSDGVIFRFCLIYYGANFMSLIE